MKTLNTILLSLLMLACTKVEIEEISGNSPPYEQIVTEQLKESYINRLYITLVGRKATTQEFDAGLVLLGDSALVNARKALVQSIQGLSEYNAELYTVVRADYLESIDTAVINDDYQQAVDALANSSGGAREYWLYVESTLKKLKEIPVLLDQGQISIIEIHKRAVHNIYYDDINMGSENFVVGTFQNFLFRYPTNIELENATEMVDGNPASIFLQSGSSKEEFINIFFGTDDYYEGQVINLYRKYLFKNPSTVEMNSLTKEFQASMNYQQLQTTILSNDEYFFN